MDVTIQFENVTESHETVGVLKNAERELDTAKTTKSIFTKRRNASGNSASSDRAKGLALPFIKIDECSDVKEPCEDACRRSPGRKSSTNEGDGGTATHGETVTLRRGNKSVSVADVLESPADDYRYADLIEPSPVTRSRRKIEIGSEKMISKTVRK